MQCYVLTNDVDQQVLNRKQKKCMILMTGDLMKKVGEDNTGSESVMRNNGLGSRNENRESFADFCAFNRLVIGGTLFPYKKVHDATWVSPDHVTENQIDHICISQRFRRPILDVRAKRGADVATDHHFLIRKLKLKLKRFPTEKRRTDNKYNVTLLQDHAILEQLRISLSNRFQALEDLHEEDQTLENKGQRTRRSWINTCEETVGRKTMQHKE